MKITVTPDKQSLFLSDLTVKETLQLELSFKVKTKNYYNHPAYKKRVWDGTINLFRGKRYISVGLWKELINVCEQYKLEYNNDFIYDIADSEIDKDEMVKYFNEFFKDAEKKPRYYQLDAVYIYAKYKRVICEIATGSGKTLLMYMIYKYFQHLYKQKDKSHRCLVIVPNVSLITQTYQEWIEEHNVGREPLKILLVSSDDLSHRKVNPMDYNVVIGTFQSLSKKDKIFFECFDSVLVDECHTAGTTSIKNIMSKTTNATYRLGMSGTTMVKNNDAESYGIQENLGPLLYEYKTKELIEDGYGTPAHIKMLILNYLSDDNREKLDMLLKRKNEDRGKILNHEKALVIANKKRLDYIVDLLVKTKKNTLVLYNSVEKEYGLKIKDAIRELDTDKDVYYVEGGTKQELRQIYKQKMEKGDNVILIASFGTTATGISIKNIHNIFMVESYKSEKIVKQTIGRGLRQLTGKEKVNIYDIVDDFRYYVYDKNGKRVLKTKRKNILLKHAEERMKIYIREGHQLTKHKINL